MSKQPKAHILTYHRACGLYPPEKSTGSRAVYKFHLQIGLCEGTRGAEIWEVSPHTPDPSSLHTHTHQTLITSTTVERTAHGGTGGHAAHCSCITTGARSWSSAELHGQSMHMLPTSSQTRRNALAESGDATQALSGELPFGDPGPEDFALDTIAIFEYSIGFDAGESTCRP